MQIRINRFFLTAVSALALCAFAHAGGRGDESYPQMSQSTQSRDAIEADAQRANNAMHPTEIRESQPAPMVGSAAIGYTPSGGAYGG